MLYLGLGGLLLLFSTISGSENSCSLPDFPAGGDYYPRQAKYQPGDTINYSCEKNYTLVGKRTSKCKLSGEWSNPTPFCDLKATLTHAEITTQDGWVIRVQRKDVVIDVIDGKQSTCVKWKPGDRQVVYMDTQKEVSAIGIFFESGTANIDIYTGKKACVKDYIKRIDTSQWVVIKCKGGGVLTHTVEIHDKSPKGYLTTVCEIEVYVTEEDECENPPDIQVANGYFRVSRSKADLVCEDGFRSEKSRLVCEGNEWKGERLQCEEILCSPELDFLRKAGNEWEFLDSVKKISIGTRRQLKCSAGYQMSGEPDIIVCQKHGNWTETNATCFEERKINSEFLKERKISTRFIIYISVGTVALLIIFVLLGTTIFFVRKQCKRPVVVVYKSPTEGSVISGSEGEYATAYYETVRDYQNITPIPPTSSRPTVQMLTEVYTLPVDNKDTFRRKPMPADIAFGTLKQSTLYGC